MQINSVTDKEYANYLASADRIRWMKYTNMVGTLLSESNICDEVHPTSANWVSQLYEEMQKYPRVKTNGVPGVGQYFIAQLDREDMVRLNKIHVVVQVAKESSNRA
jgi:hypothetical protein